MTLLTFILILVIGGFVWYMAETYLPLPEPVKMVLRFVLILVLIFMVLALFGIVSMPFALK